MTGKLLKAHLIVRVTFPGQSQGGLIPVRYQNKTVRFRVVSGGGSVSPTSVKVGNKGMVFTRLTLGPNVGLHEVVASCNILFVKRETNFIATAIQPITDIISPFSTGPTANIWRKFIGERVNANVPNLVDYSYAGYKNGEERIPDNFNLRVFNVTDYGAMPNDNLSDTAGIKSAANAARSNGGIVFFPPGQYDVIMDGDPTGPIWISGDNVIVRGSGAAGAKYGGTTIKIHNKVTEGEWSKVLFHAGSSSSGWNSKTFVKGVFPKGTRHFDVQDTTSLIGRQFISISYWGLDNFDQYSSKTLEEIPDDLTGIHEGVRIYEAHEIHHIDGDRVYVKAPVLTHLNSKFAVNWKTFNVGIGFEDLHIDGNLQENYTHLEHNGRGGIMLKHAAHSWIRRCRFSNVTSAFEHKNCYATTAIEIIVDGRYGHYTGISTESTYCFFGLIEDRTDQGGHHGLSLQGKNVANVMWMIGGPTVKGPDAHGGHSRDNLFDLYYSVGHNGSGGSPHNLPHHLDGYVRWNNYADSTRTFDLWRPGGYSFSVTQASMIGYRQKGGSAPRNAYVEHFGTHISPNSLYEAQLSRRKEGGDTWIDDARAMYNVFFAEVYSRSEQRNHSPIFSNVVTTQNVVENTPKGTNIGDPYTATDFEGDTLVYTLVFGSDVYFAIDRTTGQLKTNASLDYEKKRRYTAFVKVSDRNGGENVISVTINVTDLPDSHYLYGRTQQVKDAIVQTLIDIHNEVDVTRKHLRTILTMTMSNTGLTELKSGDLEDLVALERLYLNNEGTDNPNQLQVLPVDIFKDLTYLKEINLSGNALQMLPDNVFADLTSLIILNLNDNQLTSLPAKLFKASKHLQTLSISNNQISSLPSKLFNGLTKLHSLQLDGNTHLLPIIVSLKKVGQSSFKVIVQTSAPFNFVISLGITNGTIENNRTSFTMLTGYTQGLSLSVTRDVGTTDPVLVTITTFSDLPDNHSGYALLKNIELPLEVIPSIAGAPGQIPDNTELLTNFPNPFNPDTWIPYQLAKTADVTLTIYNMQGIQIRQLTLTNQPAGMYLDRSRAIYWDGQNNAGESVASGVYFYVFKAGPYTATRKMLIRK